MKKLILLILACSFFSSVRSQDFVFEKITTQKGLSQNDVNCIFQDRRGFIWIGTNDGLNRFDGYNFKIYRLESDQQGSEGLSSNLIYKIDEDANGDLWIATSNEGVCKFNIEKEKFLRVRNTPENPNLLAANRVSDVKCMQDGTVWITSYSGVNIISETDGNVQVESLSSILSDSVRMGRCNTIEQDENGRIWLASTEGLIVLDKREGRYNVQSIAEFRGFNETVVKSIGGGLLVGGSRGIFFISDYSLTDGSYTVQKLSSSICRDLLLGRNNTLYVGSNQGLSIFERSSSGGDQFRLVKHVVQGLTESTLNRNIVMCLFEDRSGNIWIGTNGGGINKYDPNRKKFFHFKATGLPGSLSNNKIRAIFEDSRHNVWFGTEGGGLNWVGSENRDFNSGFFSYDEKGSGVENNIYSIQEVHVDDSHRIWAGAGYPSRLLQFDISGKPLSGSGDSYFPDIPSPVFSMITDKEGNVWLGTYGTSGLYKYVPKRDGYDLFNYRSEGKEGDLSSNIIRNLLQDKNGNIWIATDAGLNLLPHNELNKEKPHFRVFRNNQEGVNSLSNNYILALFESSTGDIWVGTMGGGLNKVKADADLKQVGFECIDTHSGLPNDVIKGILEDENSNLWISSNKGLSRLNPTTWEIMNYDISDGLQDFEFGELACCKLNNGMMLFGGVNGFNAFYPEQIVGDTIPPQVVFTDLQVLNQSVAVGDTLHNRILLEKVINETKQIKLKYSENSFAIYFAGLHFAAPSKNKYKYMLEGFDSGWITKNSTERSAKYTSLRPGKYTFKLYASNNDGVWSGTPKELSIVVVPPWWQSDLAIVFYVVLFILAMWFFQRYSIIRIKQKNELLMEHFEKEKSDELAQLKLRFFTNISHEFRTPLTLIIGAVQKLIKSGSDLPDETRERYQIIQRNSSIMLRLISQLMDFRKMEQDKIKLAVSYEDLVPLVKDIYSSFTELALMKDIQFNFITAVDSLMVWIDQDKIEKILYNLLSNAFKFTGNDGKIDIIIFRDQDHVIVSVKDNGIGIPKEMQTHIFERFYQATKLKQTDFAGTGIGLSYSKGLAEIHYGDLRFTSEEGSGSCFELVMKLGNAHFKQSDYLSERVKQQNKEVLRASDVINLSPTQPKTGESIKSGAKDYSLLIVEDNPDLLAFLASSFEGEYNVYLAENGQIGFDLALEKDVDLIISDISMPVKTGFELCSDIKLEEKTSHIPVILLTAKSTSEDTIKGYEVGADAYVVKPFDIDVLEAQVKSILNAREELKEKFRKSIEITPSEVTTTNADEKFLAKLLSIVEENIMNSEFSVEQLANEYGLSQIFINKKLKSLTGHTANTFIRSVRLKRAGQLLKTGRYTVADVTYEVGFSDLKYFRSCFKKEFKMTPSDFIKQYKED